MGGRRHALAVLAPGMRPSTHCTGGQIGFRTGLDWYGKMLPQLGFDPRTIQPVASPYTNYAFLAHTRIT